MRAAALQPVLDFARPQTARAGLARAVRLSLALAGDVLEGLTATDVDIPCADGARSILLRVYRPSEVAGTLPALLFLHGGAFVAGDLDSEHVRCAMLSRRAGVVVVSVDYRLAPEHPFPAALYDCRDALGWLHRNARALRVDRSRLAIGGASAGGALAAATALMARDSGGPPLRLQLLLYPVLDDLLTTRSMRTFVDTPGWNAPNSRHMWHHYLGDAADTAAISPYAAPARARDLIGLPAAYVLTAALDPLRDEGAAYADRLRSGGVAVRRRQFAGSFHGFDMAAPHAPQSRRALDEQVAVLRSAFGTRRTRRLTVRSPT